MFTVILGGLVLGIVVGLVAAWRSIHAEPDLSTPECQAVLALVAEMEQNGEEMRRMAGEVLRALAVLELMEPGSARLRRLQAPEARDVPRLEAAWTVPADRAVVRRLGSS